MPLDHLGINVPDVRAARSYYDELMPLVGFASFFAGDDWFSYAPADGPGTQLFFSSGGAIGTGTQDIYVSDQRADGTFGARSLVSGLNTATDDTMPNLGKDGLEVVFASTRAGGAGSFDIWTSSRSSVFDAWSAPVNVTVVNTVASETRPSLSWDGERLYVGRAGDIYVSHR